MLCFSKGPSRCPDCLETYILTRDAGSQPTTKMGTLTDLGTPRSQSVYKVGEAFHSNLPDVDRARDLGDVWLWGSQESGELP